MRLPHRLVKKLVEKSKGGFKVADLVREELDNSSMATDGNYSVNYL